jgi:uncharacterized membrane protein YvlD (DUF360 family)
MKRGIVKSFEDFEFYHGVIAFLIILILTILVTRGLVYYIIDPNLKIFGYELHHFDYGLLILVVTSLLLLFGEKHFELYLILIAISLGLIIDELWFVTGSIGRGNPAFYNQSFFYVITFSIVLSLVIFLVMHFGRKRK